MARANLLLGVIALVFIAAVAPAIWGLIRSAVKPKSDERLAWYDRGLRVIGAAILSVFLVGLLFLVSGIRTQALR